jgi:hypothetical protein
MRIIQKWKENLGQEIHKKNKLNLKNATKIENSKIKIK